MSRWCLLPLGTSIKERKSGSSSSPLHFRKEKEMKKYQPILWGLSIVILMVLSFWSGATMQSIKNVEEYEQGFKDGWKDALYTRPVHDELEMVCLGLWTATLIERKDK